MLIFSSIGSNFETAPTYLWICFENHVFSRYEKLKNATKGCEFQIQDICLTAYYLGHSYSL